jgi:ABC-2 type transport system ATP-binding protein
MDTDAAVMVRDLRKGYPGVTAVDGIDLDIARGEVFALLGPNGAGKTTTVEILEGFRQRDGGTVAVLGHDPAHGSRAWRARIGIVLQLASTGPELTVTEMVRHFASFYPRPRDPEEAIELVGLTAKARSRIASLSGGQTRRLDVALGIVGRPELLFLDEPTTGFDPEARRQFWELIRGLRTDGTTILLTTHYLDEAEALADRIAVIAAGRIVASGDPGSLGGRAAADARVSWDEPAAPGRPPGRSTVQTPMPTRLVTELASRFGGEVPGLTVTRPSLEDIYLDLITEAGHDREP